MTAWVTKPSFPSDSLGHKVEVPQPYLLLCQLHLVELLHVLLVVLLLELPDEDLLLLVVAGILLSGVLLELHGRLRVQRCHDLLPATGAQHGLNNSSGHCRALP